MEPQNTGLPAREFVQEELEAVVRRATQVQSAQVVSWQVNKLADGRETVSDIYRIDVLVHLPTAQQPVALPLVLKAVRMTPERRSPSHWNYWLREAEAYASGCLALLPPGLHAPTCYGVTQHEDIVWIWLEHVASPPATEKDVGTVCYHLGRFNGAYLRDAVLPTGTWVTRGWLRQHVAATVANIEQLPRLQHHPLVGRAVAPHLLPDLLRLVEEREALLNRLEAMPQVFCHQDIHRGNLFLNRTAEDDSHLVAIDWSYTGIAAVGQELAPILFTARRLPDIYSTATRHYIAGLRAVGWQGDETIILWSSAMTTALNYGVAMVGFFLGNLLDEEQHADMVDGFGVAIEHLPPRATSWVEFGLQYANLARNLE